ncbi:MAG: HAD family hydrolase [Clostridiales bacterium]|nr:HAD family hydrolase [Clostridiales bacterium]
MDTMVEKHIKCFAPKAVEIWELHNIETKFLKTWNMVNLYSKTRGINRFKGLVKTFELLEDEGLDMPDMSSVRTWIETSNELSNRSLKEELKKTRSKQLLNTLSWSYDVNTAILELAGEDKPFPKVKEGLAYISSFADIAIVSSANGSAVRDEWTRHGLSSYVQILCGQEAGTKSSCIKALNKHGYSSGKLLMIGDAPGDLLAAQRNEVLFYPILVGKEEFSWTRLVSQAMPKLADDTYSGEYQNQLIKEFISTLK